MEEQYKKTFDQMVDSLKMYQRYELKDKNRKDILDKVYVDPIENDGILNLCLKDNTTVLIGRRGTGKSTIFMRMQNELREYSCAVTPQVRQTGNRLSGLAGTAYASLLT